MTGTIGPSQSYFVRLATGKVLGPLFSDDVLWLRRAEAIGHHTSVLAPGETDWAPLGRVLGDLVDEFAQLRYAGGFSRA